MMKAIGREAWPRDGSAARPRLLTGVLVLAALSGCGGEASRESVSGNVTWQGRPLDQGDITFTPAAGDGLPVGGVVAGGLYDLPNPPGLDPGDYLVRVQSRGQRAAHATGVPDFGIADPASAEKIPRRYNDETTLKARVTAGGSNRFDFDLNGTRKGAARGGTRPR
jgi:hypothetical protein